MAGRAAHRHVADGQRDLRRRLERQPDLAAGEEALVEQSEDGGRRGRAGREDVPSSRFRRGAREPDAVRAARIGERRAASARVGTGRSVPSLATPIAWTRPIVAALPDRRVAHLLERRDPAGVERVLLDLDASGKSCWWKRGAATPPRGARAAAGGRAGSWKFVVRIVEPPGVPQAKTPCRRNRRDRRAHRREHPLAGRDGVDLSLDQAVARWARRAASRSRPSRCSRGSRGPARRGRCRRNRSTSSSPTRPSPSRRRPRSASSSASRLATTSRAAVGVARRGIDRGHERLQARAVEVNRLCRTPPKAGSPSSRLRS